MSSIPIHIKPEKLKTATRAGHAIDFETVCTLSICFSPTLKCESVIPV